VCWSIALLFKKITARLPLEDSSFNVARTIYCRDRPSVSKTPLLALFFFVDCAGRISSSMRKGKKDLFCAPCSHSSLLTSFQSFKYKYNELKPNPNQNTPTTHALKMKLRTHFILGLLLFANYCIKETHPASAASLPLSNPSSTTVFEGEEWRRHLPEKLSNRNGAPLHKIIIESTSNPLKNVTVYLLGTSHVSRTSCEDAKLLMEHARPGETMHLCSCNNISETSLNLIPSNRCFVCRTVFTQSRFTLRPS
jgi:hypothetical protein